MAELKCSDGTVIKISKETEDELRKAFGIKEPKLDFIEFDEGDFYPIRITEEWLDVKEGKQMIEELNKAIDYCQKKGWVG